MFRLVFTRAFKPRTKRHHNRLQGNSKYSATQIVFFYQYIFTGLDQIKEKLTIGLEVNSKLDLIVQKMSSSTAFSPPRS